MPLARYFLFVGAALLALLFLSDAVFPKLPAVGSEVASISDTARELPTVRISSDRKWPERIVFDTSLAPAAPVAKPQLAEATPAATAPVEVSPVAEYPAKARVRESVAQFKPADEPVKVEPTVHVKRKVAKAKVAPPMRLVAQQGQFGFFGNNTW